MDQEVQFLPSAGSRQPAEQEESPGGGGGNDGILQAVVTYTVMDDLTVKPMSAVTSITLLTTFAVADLAALQERTVRIGHAEVTSHLHRLLFPLHRSRPHLKLFATRSCSVPPSAGFGDPQGLAAVQDCPHRCFPRKKAAPGDA
jgi:hypothetical protein